MNTKLAGPGQVVTIATSSIASPIRPSARPSKPLPLTKREARRSREKIEYSIVALEREAKPETRWKPQESWIA